MGGGMGEGWRGGGVGVSLTVVHTALCLSRDRAEGWEDPGSGEKGVVEWRQGRGGWGVEVVL